MSQLDELPSVVFPEASMNARPLANYVAENLSEEGFLEDVEGSRVRLCTNHYWIGLVRLSEGDRQGTRSISRSRSPTGSIGIAFTRTAAPIWSG